MLHVVTLVLGGVAKGFHREDYLYPSQPGAPSASSFSSAPAPPTPATPFPAPAPSPFSSAPARDDFSSVRDRPSLSLDFFSSFSLDFELTQIT